MVRCFFCEKLDKEDCGTSKRANLLFNLGGTSNILPLTACQKSITNHLCSLGFQQQIAAGGMGSFPETEVNLILMRSGMEDSNEDQHNAMTICLNQRLQLGIGYKQLKVCKHPRHSGISAGKKFSRKLLKGRFGTGLTIRLTVGPLLSRLLLKKEGQPVELGAGLCWSCAEEAKDVLKQYEDEEKSKLNQGLVEEESEPPELGARPAKIAATEGLQEMFSTQPFGSQSPIATSDSPSPLKMLGLDKSPKAGKPVDEPECQLYNELMTKLASLSTTKVPLPKLRHQVQLDWETSEERTKRGILAVVAPSVVALLEAIAPGQASALWLNLKDSHRVELLLGIPYLSDISDDDPTLSTLKQIYLSVESKITKIQILSIITTCAKKRDLFNTIPGLTEWMYRKARKHAKSKGPGLPPEPFKIIRTRITDDQIVLVIQYMTQPEFLQEVAFGTRLLKLDSGETREIPDALTKLSRARLVDSYVAHCKAINYTEIPSRRMLFKMLEIIGSKQIKSWVGLDNFTVDAHDAFAVLFGILEKCEHQGIPMNRLNPIKLGLKHLKQYLKSDFPAHILENFHQNPCKTHCTKFALSVPNLQELRSNCSHEHAISCSQCNAIHSLQYEMNEILSHLPASAETAFVRVHMGRQVDLAFETVLKWRSHILRGVHQETAKTNILRNLKSDEVLVIFDYAMKWIPMWFRSSQTDTYGLRGLSWHVTCFAALDEEADADTEDADYEVFTIIHVVGDAPQDWFAVASILEHGLSCLKKLKPGIQKIFFRSDQASYYSNPKLICSLGSICNRLKLKAMRYDFSEPQCGKDICDRKIAHIKAHIRRYVAEMHNASTPKELFEAICSEPCVTGCHAVLCEMEGVSRKNTVQGKHVWPDFKRFNNMVYKSADCIVAFEAYDVGTGREFSISRILQGQTLGPTNLKIVADLTSPAKPAGKISSYKNRRPISPAVSDTSINTSIASVATDASGEDTDDLSDDIFCCPTTFCKAMFMTESELDDHLALGNHEIQRERQTTYDRIREIYAEHVTGLKRAFDQTVPRTLHDIAEELTPEERESAAQFSPEQMGWARYQRAKPQKKSDDCNQWLDEMFAQRRSAPDVCDMMKNVTTADGHPRFEPDEHLTRSKIIAHFGRLKSAQDPKKPKLLQASVDTADEEENDDDTEEMEAIETEVFYADLLASTAEQIRLKHPVTVDGKNLCDLKADNNLDMLTVTVLRRALEQCGESTKSKDKKGDLLDKLSTILDGCTCVTKTIN